MQDLNKHVGSRIRLYRQMKKLTLTELAGRVHKSKATLSKYETGDITVDIQTLFEIAAALSIKVSQLIDYVPSSDRSPTAPDSFFPQRFVYLYFYDGRTRRTVRSVLEPRHEGAGSIATFYHDLEDLRRPERCRNLYVGRAEYFDTMSYFSFRSQSNKIDRVTLCAANPFDRSGRVLGMLTGISRYPMLPVSIKCILSAEPLTEDEELRRALFLSPADRKLTKALNMFAVEQTV